MVEAACCTCAKLLSAISALYDEKTEKPFTHDRQLQCCGRFICGVCIAKNSRFASYCPFCQISTTPSSLPQGLRDPPAYSPLPIPNPVLPNENELPTYSSLNFHTTTERDKSTHSLGELVEDVLHFVDPVQDTIPSLSLRYGVPQDALRRTNSLFANNLLSARRTILIPGEYYKGGVSLSSRPIEGEEEWVKKFKIRRWMVACKVAEYDVALLYLQQANYDLDAAIKAYLGDEQWEKDHPIESSSKGKAKQKPERRKFGVGIGITGQL